MLLKRDLCSVFRLYLFTFGNRQKQIVFQVLLHIQIIDPLTCFYGFRVQNLFIATFNLCFLHRLIHIANIC